MTATRDLSQSERTTTRMKGYPSNLTSCPPVAATKPSSASWTMYSLELMNCTILPSLGWGMKQPECDASLQKPAPAPAPASNEMGLHKARLQAELNAKKEKANQRKVRDR
jgi:hypothetical protein